GGTPPYAWSITAGTLPAGLTLNRTTGQISGVPTATAPGFTVTVSDQSGQAASKQLTITVNPSRLTITTSSLPDGVVSATYAAPPLSANGGTPPYSWSIASGELPPGLSLSPSGSVSGTPARTGAYTFNVRATDSDGSSAEIQSTIRITSGL